MFILLITVCALAQHCCKGDERFQYLPAQEPLNRFSKIFAQLITSATPPHMQKFGSVGPKWVCLRMREFVIVRRLFNWSLVSYLSLYYSKCVSVTCHLDELQFGFKSGLGCSEAIFPFAQPLIRPTLMPMAVGLRFMSLHWTFLRLMIKSSNQPVGL